MPEGQGDPPPLANYSNGGPFGSEVLRSASAHASRRSATWRATLTTSTAIRTGNRNSRSHAGTVSGASASVPAVMLNYGTDPRPKPVVRVEYSLEQPSPHSMRRTALLFLFAVLVACSGPQQTSELPEGVSDKRAPQEANVVRVQTEESPQEAYRTSAQVLQSAGYALGSTSDELKSITTEKKASDPRGIVVGLPQHRFSISVRKDPTVIQVTGAAFFRGRQYEIKKYGQTNSPQRLSWKQMITISHSISEKVDGSLSYGKTGG